MGLAATAALQRARLVESWQAPLEAVALADAAVATDGAGKAPLWWADHADVRCRIALSALDFHAAVGHARRAIGHARVGAVWPGYHVPYRANEAYALLGTGAIDEALACFRAIGEIPMPRYQAARVQCLAEVVALTAADRRGEWTTATQSDLAKLMVRLRELEWPSVLPTLPETIACLFARALAAGIEVDWLGAAIRTRSLPAPRGAPEAWPWSVRVRALGPFEVVTASGPLRQAQRDARKASSKPLDLLRFMSAHGHDAVPVDVAAAALWAGDGREGRQKAFDVTVARLRRLLGNDGAIIVNDRRVRLAERCVWSDVQALNDSLGAAKRHPRAARRPALRWRPRSRYTAGRSLPTARSRGSRPSATGCARASLRRFFGRHASLAWLRRAVASGSCARSRPTRASSS